MSNAAKPIEGQRRGLAVALRSSVRPAGSSRLASAIRFQAVGDKRDIQLKITLDGQSVTSETTCTWAGPYALAVETTLPDRGLAVELHSLFVGHEDVPTCATHLSLGPVGRDPSIFTTEHEHSELDPKTEPRECAYEHMNILVEILTRLGYQVALDVADQAFGELERVDA